MTYKNIKINYRDLIKIFQAFLLTFIFISCNNSSGSSNNNSSFDNGEYCAEIHYYYSQTGTSSNYTLLIEVEDGKLIKILWSNGGWLDDTHFDPPDIEDGTTEFTSFEGVQYTVKIIGSGGNCSTSNSTIDEDELIINKRNRAKRIQEEEEEELEEERRRKEDEEKRKRQREEEEENNKDDDDK